MSTALLTDHYELTMVDAALADGTAERPTVFEAFARSLPEGRRYGVVAGLDRILDAIEALRFGDDELAFLDDHDIVSPRAIEYLARLRFTGDVHAYPEGELHFPGSPVVSVVAPFAQAAVLETVLLSILNHDSAVAAAAARMVQAARGRSLMEFGGRRTHEQAAVAAARAAYLVGFSGTSSLEAGRRHGVPTLGTAAHSFTLLHDDEPQAFRGQVDGLGASTTLLIDTYDVEDGLEHALRAAGAALGGVRIDSGDLGTLAGKARRRLDEAGATDTRIVLSGDLDEHRIAALADAPADGYGVGTSVVTGAGAPAAGFVYKMVARAREPGGALEPVAKRGTKATHPGRTAATRELDGDTAVAERLRPHGHGPGPGRPLQTQVIRDGEVLHRTGLEEAREHHRRAVAELPSSGLDLEPGDPAIPTVDERRSQS